MDDAPSNLPQLLANARQRGGEVTATLPLPAGLDHFTAYVGLIRSALELGKLATTEKRDLAVIGSHHAIEMARIEAASRELEARMVGDFHSDETLKEKTFSAIEALIAAGQFEIAGEFHSRLMANFTPR